MITAKEAIRAGRALLETPYAQMDCINYIKHIIRTTAGGVPSYTTAGTNSLWNSYGSAGKYRDLTWRQESLDGAQAGMLAFKRDGSDVHHVGLVTGEGTVLHSSSAIGCVVETDLYNGQWRLLAMHRYIAVGDAQEMEEGKMSALYSAIVTTEKDPLRVRSAPQTGAIIDHVPRGKIVEVLAESNTPGWVYIRYGALEGYASGEYLQRIADTEHADTETNADDNSSTCVIPYALAKQLYNALGNALSID